MHWTRGRQSRATEALGADTSELGPHLHFFLLAAPGDTFLIQFSFCFHDHRFRITQHLPGGWL